VVIEIKDNRYTGW